MRSLTTLRAPSYQCNIVLSKQGEGRCSVCTVVKTSHLLVGSAVLPSLCQLQLCTPVANPLSTESTSTESKMHFRLHYQLNFDWKVESLEVLYANEIILRGSAPGSGTENSCKSKCDCKLLSHLLLLSSSTLWLHTAAHKCQIVKQIVHFHLVSSN